MMLECANNAHKRNEKEKYATKYDATNDACC